MAWHQLTQITKQKAEIMFLQIAGIRVHTVIELPSDDGSDR